MSCVENNERQILPKTVKPTHYELTLQPDLTIFTFHGQVKVNLVVKQSTCTIVLNSRELKINSAKATLDLKQYIADVNYDEKNDTVVLNFAHTFTPENEILLDIDFQGELNDQMQGFYKSSYKDNQGNTQYLATTQMESTDARRVFPCWDEPALKATYDVTLIVPENLTALSNMDVISESNTEKGLKKVKFGTTPLMSTYLLAFVIGPFEYIEGFTSGEHNGRPIRSRVYALPGSVEHGKHALNVCIAALEYFAKVFGEPYPLPKMDLVAIPDFEAGAMENWGLITFRTVSLLFDEKSSSIIFKKSTAYTICHEIAHQWFGNLVTMEWWNDLWLNEGFASFVGWWAVGDIFPDWDIWTSFVNEDMPKALELDALRSSHPIQVTVNHPSEIHQIFDAISYYKSASVIRMLGSWLGEEVFLAGVRHYVKRHKLGNASTVDLWKALSEIAQVDVSQFMTLWTKRVGYPVLNIELIDDQIKVTQSRYLSTGDLKPEEDRTAWWAPLRILVPGKIESFTLTEKSQLFPVSGTFKLNAGQTSVYRVNYPIEIIRVLAEEIKKGPQGMLTNISDRVGLVSDAANLCLSGEQTTVAFLELAQAFIQEESYFVWSQISTHLSKILSVWYEQPKQVCDGLMKVRRDLFAPVAHKLGWDFNSTDDYLTNILRVLAITNAGRSDDPSIVNESKKRFWAFVKGDNEALHPNLRGPVYNIVLGAAEDEAEEEKMWEHILDIYRDESLPTDQRLIALNALGGVKSHTLLYRYLDMSMDEKEIRGQDCLYVYSSLGSNPAAHKLFWEFFTSNYFVLYAKFSKSMKLFVTALRAAVGGFVTSGQIEEAEEFFKDKDTRQYARFLQQALEGARVNTKWVERDQALVAQWIGQSVKDEHQL